MVDDRVSRFNFGGASPLELYIIGGLLVILFGYILFLLLKNYREDRKKFGWLYELSKETYLTGMEIDDLKEIAEENEINNPDQLYRVIHSVRMRASTRRKLLFGSKEVNGTLKGKIKTA